MALFLALKGKDRPSLLQQEPKSVGHGEVSQRLWEAVAESGAWLSPALLCPRHGCPAGCCLEPLPLLLPVQQLCPVLALCCLCKAGWGWRQGRAGVQGGEGCQRGD